MKKLITILIVIILVVAYTATAQIQRGSKKQEAKPKTEKTTKKKENNKPKKQPATKSNQKSSKQSSSTPNANKSSSSQTNVATARPTELTAYDVKFSCNVNEATIYIDGSDYGRPNGMHTLKTGNHQVKLVAEGYEDYTTTINIVSGNTMFDFKMTRAIPKEPYVAKVETFMVKGVSFDMIFVEGGTFMMGATEDDKEVDYRDKPAHQVTLSDYYIGKFEVTQELWKALMGKNHEYFKGGEKYPVGDMSRKDILKFIKKLNKLTGRQFRLPTEAEWEYAARGGKWSRGFKFSGSDTLDNVGWYFNNSSGKLHPVGMKNPNELGIYDMSGNVKEWCSDWFGEYPMDPQTDPVGSLRSPYCSGWIYRGGGFGDQRLEVPNPGVSDRCYYPCSVTHRRGYDDDDGYWRNIGFRLAL